MSPRVHELDDHVHSSHSFAFFVEVLRVFLLNFLFLGRRAPDCKAACDPFASGFLGTTAAVGIFDYLFLGGPAPLPPFPDCGVATPHRP